MYVANCTEFYSHIFRQKFREITFSMLIDFTRIRVNFSLFYPTTLISPFFDKEIREINAFSTLHLNTDFTK